MNERHLEALASDEWRHTLETLAFPFAFGSGGPTILGDDPLEALHDDDIYNPVDPTTIESRLVAADFADIDVNANEYAWAVRARRAG